MNLSRGKFSHNEGKSGSTKSSQGFLYRNAGHVRQSVNSKGQVKGKRASDFFGYDESTLVSERIYQRLCPLSIFSSTKSFSRSLAVHIYGRGTPHLVLFLCTPPGIKSSMRPVFFQSDRFHSDLGLLNVWRFELMLA